VSAASPARGSVPAVRGESPSAGKSGHHGLLALALCLGLVTTASAGPQAPVETPAWPPPPAAARVRFLRALDPMAVRGKPSFFSKVLTLLVGDRETPSMRQPYGIAVGADRRIYVADTFGRAIHVYDLKKPGYSSIRVDGDSLIGVAVVGAGLYVTDSVSGRVIALDAKGRTRWTLGRSHGFDRPTGLVAAPDRLFVVDTRRGRVVIVGLDGTILGSFGETGSGQGQFNYPTNIARSSDGRLYVTDTMNFRVQIFDAEGRYLSAFGHLGDGSGDFDKPKGIAVDSGGHIYVVEGLNDVVQMFDDAGRLLLVFGGSGTRAGELYLPSGIAITSDVIYVADSANRRVAIFEYLGEPR
jgi:DNA-binding beta-propeller fold protein YncE